MAKMVYRVISGEGKHAAQFDEQVRLVQAGNKKEAFEKARLMGWQHETSFFNQKNQSVKWVFIDVAELQKLPPLDHGTEVYSRLSESDQAATFINIVHHHAELIRSSVADLSTELI